MHRTMATSIALAALAAPQAHAATLSAPGPGGTVQEVIDAASPGDVIEVDSGGYAPIVIPVDLILRSKTGNYDDVIFFAGSGDYSSVVVVQTGVTAILENIIFDANYSHSIQTEPFSHVTLNGVVASQGLGVDGGSILALGELVGNGLMVYGNSATNGAGVFAAESFSCTGCVFGGGTASQFGGAIFADGPVLELVDSVFEGSSAGILGDAIYTQAASNLLTRVLFCGDNPGTVIRAADGASGTFSNVYIEESPIGVHIEEGTWLLQNLLFANTTTNIELSTLATAEVVNSHLFGADVGITPNGAALTEHHNAFTATDVEVLGASTAPSSLIDPLATYDRFAGLCEPLILAPRFDADLIDAGEGQDPDGSAADIGASGGPQAWAFMHADADLDAFSFAKECDDAQPASYPGATEICDGIDNDCMAGIDVDAVDKSYWFLDHDSDGYGDGATSAGVQLYQCDPPADWFDGTAYVSYAPSGNDCNDFDAAINPGAIEQCDAIDHNCDSSTTFNAVNATNWYLDLDGDGAGDGSIAPVRDCVSPGLDYIAADGSDCDDTNPAIAPTAVELCDGIDNNCSGNELDANNVSTSYADADQDGYPDLARSSVGCQTPLGYIPARADGAVDCDDTEAQAFPTNIETCDGIDNDCNRTVDDVTESPPTWYADDDADGFGSALPGASISSDCPEPGYVQSATDCRDTDPEVHPGAVERCNGIDDDCSGVADDGPTDTFYVDADGDGYGAEPVTTSCRPEGVSDVGGDCQDGFAEINPGALEVPGNDIDEDCSGGPQDPASSAMGQPASSGCQCTTGASATPLPLLIFQRRPGTHRGSP